MGRCSNSRRDYLTWTHDLRWKLVKAVLIGIMLRKRPFKNFKKLNGSFISPQWERLSVSSIILVPIFCGFSYETKQIIIWETNYAIRNNSFAIDHTYTEKTSSILRSLRNSTGILPFTKGLLKVVIRSLTSSFSSQMSIRSMPWPEFLTPVGTKRSSSLL